MTIAPSDPVTTAVLAALDAASLIVGDAEVPDPIVYPYSVVYGGGEAGLDGPLGDPKADGKAVVQVTSVGRSREGAGAQREAVKAVVLDRHQLDVAERRVVQVELVTSRPITRDDELGEAQSEFYGVDVFHISTSPTT